MPIGETSENSTDQRLQFVAYLKAYLPASEITMSPPPFRSLSPQISKTLPQGPANVSSSFFMTSPPTVSRTVRHSFTKALIVHRVLIRTVEVVDAELEPAASCDKQVRRGLRRSSGRLGNFPGYSIRAMPTSRNSCGRAIYSRKYAETYLLNLHLCLPLRETETNALEPRASDSLVPSSKHQWTETQAKLMTYALLLHFVFISLPVMTDAIILSGLLRDLSAARL
jgi:hypothetical protein